MRQRLPLVILMACAATVGCRLPGRRAANVTPQRPDQVVDYETLYGSNCAACHGSQGRHGAAISLANPVYLAYAGEQNIADLTAKGIRGSLMPAFSREQGGLLTDAQITILADGMVTRWGRPQALHGVSPPPFISHAVGDPGRGESAYRQQCLHCHAPGTGSLLDPAYLALISDGGLRTFIVAGRPEQGMPDWEGYGAGPLGEQEIADLISFLASHRTPASGRPYPGSADGDPSGTQDKTKATQSPTQEKVSN